VHRVSIHLSYAFISSQIVVIDAPHLWIVDLGSTLGRHGLGLSTRQPGRYFFSRGCRTQGRVADMQKVCGSILQQLQCRQQRRAANVQGHATSPGLVKVYGARPMRWGRRDARLTAGPVSELGPAAVSIAARRGTWPTAGAREIGWAGLCASRVDVSLRAIPTRQYILAIRGGGGGQYAARAPANGRCHQGCRPVFPKK